MALEIKTEIIINATPDKVWAVFSDYAVYSEWNPFILLLTGEVKIGQKIKAEIQPPGAKSMTFKPKVLTLEKNTELSWLGHLLLPGIFDGLHHFQLVDNGDGTTTFIQSEKFSGILVPFMKKSLNGNTKNGFMEMNLALKTRVENRNN